MRPPTILLIVLLSWFFITVIACFLLTHSGRKRLRAAMLALLLVLSPVSLVFVAFVLQSFPLRGIHIIPREHFPYRIPSVISTMMVENPRIFLYHDVFTPAETIEITYLGTATLYSYQIRRRDEYTQRTPSRPTLALVYGDIIVDGVEYEYFLLMQRLPLTNSYITRNIRSLGLKGAEFNNILSGTYNFFGLIFLDFDRSSETVSGIRTIYMPYRIGFLIFLPVWAVAWCGFFRGHKKKTQLERDSSNISLSK